MPGSTYGEDGSGAETLYMILTWVGIVVMVVVLVAWVLYENRRLIQAVAGYGGDRAPDEPGHRPSPEEWETADDQQRKRQEADRVPAAADSQEELRVAMLAISILCAIVVLVIVLFTNIGTRVPSNRLSHLLLR